jgi:F-type H+-transporting ATPase subunit b
MFHIGFVGWRRAPRWGGRRSAVAARLLAWLSLVLLCGLSPTIAIAAEGGGHHNEADLSHANDSGNMQRFDVIRPDMAIASLIVFALLMAILYRYAWKPIAEGLAKRESGIRQQIDSAQQANSEAQRLLAEYKRQLESASAETQAALAQARQEGEALRQRIVDEAKEEAVRQRERAVADIESAKQQALTAIAEQTTDVAVRLAKDVVGREVKRNDHDDLIRRAVEQLAGRN